MTQSIQPGRFGESGKPDDTWLAKQENEPILEPELPIIDPHHHLWDRGGWTYLLPELLADLNTGHNIVATVFEECRSMYRANGPVEMRPVGEVEFVAGCRGSAAVNAAGSVELRPRCGFGRPLARTRLGRVLQVRGCRRTRTTAASVGWRGASRTRANRPRGNVSTRNMARRYSAKAE